MIFRFTLLFLLCFCFSTYAQKEDRNWVFGYNAGIDFSDLNNPRVYETNIDQCYEIAASISDSAGNLVLYLGESSTGIDNEIFNSAGNRISNSDIKLINSFSKGAFFLPDLFNKHHYYIIYTALMEDSICPRSNNSLCFGLHYSIIYSSTDSSRVIQKDIPLGDLEVYEGINAVKHSNGFDWWLIAKEMPKNGTCTDVFITYLLTSNGFIGPYLQNIGQSYCNRPLDPGAGIVVSSSGEKIVFHGYSDINVLELFDFDRCEGELYNYQNLDSNNLSEIYGCEFSPNSELLYISELGNVNKDSKLIQFDLNTLNKSTIWSDASLGLNDFTLTQLKLAPDNRIYVSYSQRDFRLTKFNQYNKHLSIINHPNRIGLSCDFRPFEFELADSSFAFLALPHMPNYNLEPEGIYKANAGNDTLFCKNYMSGVKLGNKSVSDIEYNWYPAFGLSQTNMAQPIASPNQDTWYYVELTDVTASSSCNYRLDSVFVKVETCTGIESQTLETDLNIYPNPTNNLLNFESSFMEQVEIFNLTGKQITSSSEHQINVQDFPSGIYIYQVQMNNGTFVRGKFVKQ